MSSPKGSQRIHPAEEVFQGRLIESFDLVQFWGGLSPPRQRNNVEFFIDGPGLRHEPDARQLAGAILRNHVEGVEHLPILRRRAEDILRERIARSSAGATFLSAREGSGAVRGVSASEIELELQNEELRRALGQVEASRSRYTDLYDQAPVGYVTVSEQGLILQANLTAAELLCTPRNELIDHPMTRFISKADQNLFSQHFQQLFETGDHQAYDLRMGKKGGVAFWVHLTATTSKDGSGTMVCRLVLIDITARKQAEINLLESEQKFRAIFGSLTEGVALHELVNDENGRIRDYRILDVNPAYQLNTGLDPSIALGRLATDLYGSPSPPYLEEYSKVALDGVPYSFETYFPPLGKHFRISVISPRHGQFATVFEDISERKQAEITLRETNAYLENLINYANAPIIVWDPKFKITRFNHAFESLTGRIEAGVLGKSLEILFPAALSERSMDLIRRTQTGERWETVEIKILNLDRTVKTVLWNSATLFASDGTTPVSTMAQGQDITERKQAEDALRESEEKYRRLVLDMHVGLLLQGPQAEILMSNPRALELLGISEDQLLGKTSFDPEWNVIHEDGSPFPGPTHPVPQAIASKHSIQNVIMGVYHPLRKNRIWLSVDAEPQLDRDGTIRQVVCTFIDISKRMEAEEWLRIHQMELEKQNGELLRAHEELDFTRQRYFDLYDLAPVGYVTVSENGLILEANLTAAGMLGVIRDSLIKRPLSRFILEEDQALYYQSRKRLIDLEQPQSFELRVKRKDGTTFWAHLQGSVAREADGAPVLRVALSDITERKQAEDALRESNELLSLFIYNSPIYAYIKETTSTESRVLQASENFQNLIGIPGSEMVGKTMVELFSVEVAEKINADDWAVVLGGKVTELEEEFNGRSYLSLKFPITQGKKTLLAGFTIDITERKLSERFLLASEEKFSKTFNAAPILVSLTNFADGRLIEVNDQYCEALGYTRVELLGKTTVELGIITPEVRKKLIDVIEFPTGTPKRVEFSIQSKTGQTMPILLSGSVVEIGGQKILISMVMDISELKQAEADRFSLQAQLQQSQKMESLGVLAGGVAHDMNNVLGAILGLASAFVEIQPEGAPAHSAFDTIFKAATRGGVLVKSLLAFARQTLPSEQELDLNEILQDEERILARSTLARVQLRLELAPDLRPILGDVSALTHAFMNLCVNAVDAMPDSGTLTLLTRNVDNDWAEVVLEDNGTGMSKEVLAKAMDPFFTTKAVGKGTGLGLPMVYTTVKAHHGQLEIQSEPGQGTRVRMRFPACTPRAKVPGPVAKPQPQPSPGGLSVLLVDDDELIQASFRAILEVLGHNVTATLSGEKALEEIETGFQPDVVILDMNMPGLGGTGTLPRLRALLPEVPVLLSTGRVDQTALDLAAAYPGVTLLSKPFSMKELQECLELLGTG